MLLLLAYITDIPMLHDILFQQQDVNKEKQTGIKCTHLIFLGTFLWYIEIEDSFYEGIITQGYIQYRILYIHSYTTYYIILMTSENLTSDN